MTLLQFKVTNQKSWILISNNSIQIVKQFVLIVYDIKWLSNKYTFDFSKVQCAFEYFVIRITLHFTRLIAFRCALPRYRSLGVHR